MKNRIKIAALFLLPVMFMESCGTPPETTFTQWGLQVAVPEGWELTEKEDYGDNTFYIALEQRGFGNSGLLTIVWLDGEQDLEEINEAFIASIKEDDLAKNVIVRESIRSFGNFSTTAQEYVFSFMNLPHIGVIHAFHLDGHTVAVGQQWANEDAQNVKPGFARIAETLKLGEEFISTEK